MNKIQLRGTYKLNYLKDSSGLALHSLIDKRERIAGFAMINCKYGFMAGA